MILILDVKEAWSKEGKNDGSNKKRGISFQHQLSHPIEIRVGLSAWGLEYKRSECGEATKNEDLSYSFKTDLN